MPVQKVSAAGQITRFKAFVAVGDEAGHVGLGVKCAKEVIIFFLGLGCVCVSLGGSVGVHAARARRCSRRYCCCCLLSSRCCCCLQRFPCQRSRPVTFHGNAPLLILRILLPPHSSHAEYIALAVHAYIYVALKMSSYPVHTHTKTVTQVYFSARFFLALFCTVRWPPLSAAPSSLLRCPWCLCAVVTGAAGMGSPTPCRTRYSHCWKLYALDL